MAKAQKKRLGEILLAKGLISHPQLTEALKNAHQHGTKLGASLIVLGYVTEKQILETLSESLRVPFIDISTKVISVDTQKRFPGELVKRYNVVPVEIQNRRLTLAMEDPTDYAVIEDIRFKTDLTVYPVLASSYQVGEIIKFFEQVGYAKKPYELGQLKKISDKMETLNIDDLLSEMVRMDGSDLHVTVGVPPSVRVGNQLMRLKLPIVDVETSVKLVREILTDEQKKKLAKNEDVEIAYMKENVGRFRVVVYRQRRSLTICARNLKFDIPSFDTLGLPAVVKELTLTRQGLILVTGPTGHGKSTTLASLIDLINENRAFNIVTLEDPIEYLHKHKKSNINQRSVGEDTPSFVSGLKHIFRQNPDVIMIGELRDADSIYIAMKAAATGHLVLATMHTMDTCSTVDTIMNYFSGNEHNVVRQMLADSLVCVIAQRLVPRKSAPGRVLAYEIMQSSSRVSSLIREGKPYQLKVQSTSASADMQVLELSLASLYKRGIISYEDAVNYALSKKAFDDLIAL